MIEASHWRLRGAAIFFVLTTQSLLHLSSAAAGMRAHAQVQSVCAEVRPLLWAALADRAGSADVLGPDAPQFQSENNRASNGAPLRQDSGYWRLGWHGKSPPGALIEQWYKRSYVSIGICFEGLKHEKPFGALVDHSVDELKPIDGKDSSMLQVSYPAVNSSRTQAVLIYSRTFRKHPGGRTELVFLSRDRSGWKKMGWRLLTQE